MGEGASLHDRVVALTRAAAVHAQAARLIDALPRAGNGAVPNGHDPACDDDEFVRVDIEGGFFYARPRNAEALREIILDALTEVDAQPPLW